MEFVDVEDARRRDGMRLVTVGGIPSPWSEAAKGIFRVKKIPFVGVRLMPGDKAVPEWSGHGNAPVALYDDERGRAGWAEILLLAERVAPEQPLVPLDAAERALLFGIAHEICGEMGLGWCRRLDGVHASLASDGATGFPKPVAEYLAGRYGYRAEEADLVHRRVLDVLGLLSRRLHAQRERGSPYYLGESLTALDLYSAAFMVMGSPLPPEQCPMPEVMRAAFEAKEPDVLAALDPILIEHRDRIYAEHLELPLTL